MMNKRFVQSYLLFMGIIGIFASCHEHNMPAKVHESEPSTLPSLSNMHIVLITGDYTPAAKICTWKDNRKAAYTIAFDDARASHFKIAGPELQKRGMVGTFNLNTKDVSWWGPWQQLFDAGNEIASHTWSHPRCTELSEEELRLELLLAKVDIIWNIKGILEVPSFCYPYGAYNDFVRKIVLEYHLSARAAKEGINKTTLTEEEFGMLKAICATKPCDINAMNQRVQETIKENGWAIFCFHSVSPEEEYTESTIPLSLFRQHLDFVCDMKDSLWIATQGHVAKYIKTRENAQLTCQLVNNEIIELTLSDISTIYGIKMKISFTLNLPSSWQDCYLVVNNTTLNVSEIALATGNTLLYDILPGETLTIHGVK